MAETVGQTLSAIITHCTSSCFLSFSHPLYLCVSVCKDLGWYKQQTVLQELTNAETTQVGGEKKRKRILREFFLSLGFISTKQETVGMMVK